jgi:hypothetical protein
MVDIVSALDPEVSRREHEQAIGAIRRNLHRSVDLNGQVAELRLYIAVLIRLLIGRNALTAEEFAKVAAIVDGFDGLVDGRFDGQLTPSGGEEPQTEPQVLDDTTLQELADVVGQIARHRPEAG